MAKDEQLQENAISEEVTAEEVSEMIIPENTTSEESVTAEEVSEEDLSVLTEEERKQYNELLKKMHFASHKLSKATKEEKKQMFASEHIITEDGEDVVETESTLKKQEWIELIASAKGKRILKGVIDGYRPVDSNGKIKSYLATVRYGQGTCQVLIPDIVLFNYDYKKHLDPTVQANVEKRIKNMLGAEISFVVKHFDEKTSTAIGDRLKAMEQTSWGNYIRETRDGKPRVYSGLQVQATVLVVRRDYIIVNALGSDSRITRDELAWGVLPDCREVYHIGDKVNVKVLSVTPTEVEKAGGEKYNLVATSLSVRQTYANPLVKYWDEFQVGGVYVATVTHIDDNGVFCNLRDKMPCLAAFPGFGEIPTPGKRRSITITEKVEMEDGTRRIFGVLTSM